MDIQIVTKNLNVSEDIREYAEKKIGKLSKYINNIISIKVELSQEKSKSRQQVYTAQATLNVSGFLIRGEQKAESVRASIDSVADVMERLIQKFKKKYEVNKNRESESIRNPVLLEEEQADFELAGYNIVKMKRFMLKPMSVEQAIDQMDFLGHDFFLFLDAEEDVVSVVYRRKDGKYGLIQPEFS